MQQAPGLRDEMTPNFSFGDRVFSLEMMCGLHILITSREEQNTKTKSSDDSSLAYVPKDSAHIAAISKLFSFPRGINSVPEMEPQLK